MTFVQMIEYRTRHMDEMQRLDEEWIKRTDGRRTAFHSLLGQDRADSSHYVEIVEFPSYEEAMRNSRLPETDEVFRQIVELCEEEPRFTDLEVVDDRRL